MKIAVIGTFVLDEIHNFQGKTVNSLGGISYSVSILSHLLRSDDEIIPIANVGIDGYDRITEFLSRHKNIRLHGIRRDDRNNTRVTLLYHDRYSRVEILQNRLSPIQLDQVLGIGEVDVILINFITGFEMPLDTLTDVCTQASALKYMDFHSLTLGIDENGRRFPRKPADWKEWIKYVDILQCNEDEAKILNGSDQFYDFGVHIIHNGTKILNITRGSKGSLLFVRNSEDVIYEEIPACPVDEVVDVTGCGDAFAGGFLVNYLKTKDALSASKNANRVAGFNSTLSGIEQIHLLSKFNRAHPL